MGKLMRMSRVAQRDADTEEMDSVKRYKRYGWRRAFDVLMEAQTYWNNMDCYRRDRERNKRYTYGDQWKDEICVDGCRMTEEEYIMKQGNVPLKNNMIRRLVRNVLGVYRSQSKEPTCYARDRDEQKLSETMTTILQCNMQRNRMQELYARTMEEFLIGGFVVHRKLYGWRHDSMDCWTDYVQPNNFFIDNCMRDFRGWDVSCLGEVHDISFQELAGEFAQSPEDWLRLREMYKNTHDRQVIANYGERFGYSRLQNYDFLFTADPTRCRVIEVWRRESKPRWRCHDWNSGEVYKIDTEDYHELVEIENERRLQEASEMGMPSDEVPLIETEWFIDNYWYFYYLSPWGDVLREGETPYEHKSHPYVFKAYPFIDGEIHSFVADVIDQQRYTNRLIMLYDWIMRASAKGLLLFPEDCKPEGMSMEEIADEWSRFNGMILFKAKPGVPVPQQVANNCTNIGISELLNIQLKFFEEITGVNGALQGKPGFSGQSAALYNQQTQNATTSLLDLLDSFSQFVKDAALKDVKNMQQFYDARRKFAIHGKNAYVEYDPKIKDIEFDLSIMESTSTPAYRMMANEILLQLYQQGAISVEMLLEHGDFPFGDQLLQSIKAQREQLEQGQQPEGISPELMQQAQQGANMAAVNKLYDAMRGSAAGGSE